QESSSVPAQEGTAVSGELLRLLESVYHRSSSVNRRGHEAGGRAITSATRRRDSWPAKKMAGQRGIIWSGNLAVAVASAASTAMTAASATAAVAAASSATASATMAAASTAASAATTFTLRAGFIDDERAAEKILAIQRGDHFFRFAVISNFRETEAARLSRETIAQQRE